MPGGNGRNDGVFGAAPPSENRCPPVSQGRSRPLVNPPGAWRLTRPVPLPKRGDSRRRARAMTEALERHDWTLAEVRAVHDAPLMDLVHRALTVHRSAFS